MIQTQGLLSFIIVVVTLVALVAWTAYLIRAYHHAPTEPRPDRRIPARERELLADDWRDKTGF